VEEETDWPSLSSRILPMYESPCGAETIMYEMGLSDMAR
jgi:hypothetical protein